MASRERIDLKLGVAITATVAALILTGCGRVQPGPGSTVKTMYQEINEGNLSEAIEHMQLPASADKELAKAGLSRVTEMAKKKGGLKNVEIVSEDVQGELATVVANLVFADGSTDKGTFKLIRAEKGWLLAE